MLNRVKYFFSRVAESNPYIWELAWSLVHRLTILLPHDKSYFALKHFCSSATKQLFVDIGANTGISALSFRRINKIIPIYSIEPNEIHNKSLNKLKAKLAPFDFRLIGVGDREAEIDFYTPIYRRVVLHTFTSCRVDQVYNAVSKSFGPKVAKKIIIKKFTGNIIRLDNLQLEPSIIKIDAEGFDFNVLIGGRKTISECRPFIMFEACKTDIDKFKTFFDELDYTILVYDYNRDVFAAFQQDLISSYSGGRNIFAAPNEKIKLIPIAS